jgi:hypothetical protein
MKLSVLLATVFFAAAGLASAAPLCISGTMASYELLAGGCTIGNLLFSNFAYTGVAVPNSTVTLAPVDGGYSPGPGITFSSSGWTATASPDGVVNIDSSILFDVSALDGRPIITDGSLTLLSSGSTGTGVAEIGETIEPGNIQLQVNARGPLVSHVVFVPTSTVNVLKDVLVRVPQGAAGSGTAFIGSFEEDFSEVPEPVGAILIGSGLLALGIWRRRG